MSREATPRARAIGRALPITGRDRDAEVPLLWCSPLPPTRSGVADYAAEILPHLARLTPLAVVEPPAWAPPGGEDAWLALPRVGDEAEGLPLLHMGNNPYHLWVARLLRRRGGIAVVHDLVLHHLLIEEAAEDGAWARYEEELAAAHGSAGRALAQARRWGHAGRLEPFVFPSPEVYLRHCSGAVVHNEHARAHLAERLPALPVRRVPLAVAPFPPGERAAWRRRLKLAEGELLLSHLGFLTREKGLDQVLPALAALDGLGVRFRLLVAGEGSEGEALRRAAASAGLADRVTLWGFATASDLGGLLAATDIGLVPRFPTAGETSAAALRFMAAGVPVVVSGYRQFLELPADGAFRIPPGRAATVPLVRLTAVLAGNPDRLDAARAAARRGWVDGGHAPERAAVALRDALVELAATASPGAA